MKLMKTLSAGVAALALTTAFATVATPVLAQQTTSDIRGVVTDEAGNPIAGASVVVTDVLTGTTRRVSTDATGRFGAQNLDTSGDYTVTATAAGFQGQGVENVRLSLGDTSVVSFALPRAGASGDEVVVVATRSAVAEVALGPNSTFDFDDLQSGPAASRDIKDIVRIDPRIFIDESFGNGLQCAGASPRFNSLTVDGIKLNDNFGLNANGYPTERLPFPFDSINQVAVELAPFDVEYGGFTGCNINAVTRSGSNEFHGSGWFDYTNDSLNGGKVAGSSFDKGSFNDFRFGATLSGPIIKDKLFFFAAYEKINESNIITRGPAEAGEIGVQGVSQAQLDRIVQIAQDQYGYTPTPLPSSVGQDDEKMLIKLDWNMSDAHRMALTYNRIKGNTLTASDDDPNEYEFFDHYYNRSTKLISYSGQIFSNWTDNFSTEIRASYTTNDTRQESVNGSDFGEVQIRTRNNGQNATVYFGADDSRHSNKLDTKTFNLKLKADYQLNNNLITFGYEMEQIDVFNLFIQHTEGEFRFDRVSSPSTDQNIDDFEIYMADDIYYYNTPTHNPDDGAANFGFTTHSAYLQDEVTFDEIGLVFTAGVRYDWYTSGDTPALNPLFVARNGYPNTATFDGRSLIQPRFGFNWEVNDKLSIRGGGGLFSGGNPNVWLSNSYQNDGITIVTPDIDDYNINPMLITNVDDEGGMNRAIWGIPQILYDLVSAGGSDNAVNAVDPNFNVPSQWKAALGATYDFGQDFRLMLDFIYTDDEDAAGIVDATLAQVDTTLADGRPIYRRVDFSDPNCATMPDTCTARPFTQDFILTNNAGGKQKVLSAVLSKTYEFDSGARANWSLAYAYTDAKDRNPMTSSVAFSNYVNFSTTDPNHPGLYNSNYEVPHRFTLRAGVDLPIFSSDLFTSFDLFGVASQSRPYSFIFVDGGDLFGDRLDGRHLLYVPTGADDPNVIWDGVFTDPMEIANLMGVISDLGLDKYSGMVAPRNAFQSDWYTQWDLRIEQELPGLFEGHKAKMFFILDNIGNMINDKWGVIRQAGFPGSVELIELDESGLGPNGEYIFTDYNNVTADSIQSPITKASVWQIRMGVKYEF